MKQELLLLQWRPPLSNSSTHNRQPFLRPIASSPSPSPSPSLSSSTLSGELTARERRQLRNERRESKNWREEVEDRLLIKPKKEYKSWTEKLNLDNLALRGPQWWVVRVSRVNGDYTADGLAKGLVRNYPNFTFKVYYPAVKEQRRLKNGNYSVKLKPLFPGCVFLNCIMNKEIHDFIREFDGVGGFVGAKVGNTKRQINKPKPVPSHEMEAIFQQAKEEQEKSEQAFKEEQQKSMNSELNPASIKKSKVDTKPGRKPRKGLNKLSESSSLSGEKYESLSPGASVSVLSGPFSGFTGRLKALDHKNGKATVGFMLFGKESFVELEVEQIVAETITT